jgi:soluble lytic murein transglycosylase-like protein
MANGTCTRQSLVSARITVQHTSLRIILWVGLLTTVVLSPLTAQAAAQTTPDPELRQRLMTAVSTSTSFSDRFEAEVWLMDMSHRLKRHLPNTDQRLDFLRLVHQESTQAGLPPELVLAVIEVESSFNRWAISRSGAQGLMQIMPFWLKEIGRPGDNLLQPATNLRLGCTILKYYLDMEQGHLRPALARYNGSLGRRQYPDKIFNALNTRWYRL